MKKSILFVLVMLCCCMLFLVACDNTPQDPGTNDPGTNDPGTNDPGTTGETYELKMSLQDAIGNPCADSAVRACEAIAEATDGQVNITYYPAGVLGDYITIYEDLQKSAIDLATMSLAETFCDLFMVMTLPYAVSSFEQATALYNPDGSGALYNIMKQGCEETGTNLISAVNAGFMGVGGAKLGNMDTILDPTIKQEGCVIRVPMMDVYVNMVEAMGFSVTTIAYGDVYTSLQTGVCDGLTGTSAVTAWEAFRDVLNYWVDFKHILEMAWIVASDACIEKLPAELMAEVEKAFVDEYWNSTELREQQDLQAIADLEEFGLECMNPSAAELEPMVKHIQTVCWPYYAQFFEARGGQAFLDEILAEIDKI